MSSISFFVGLIISVLLARWVRSMAEEQEMMGRKVPPFGKTAWAILTFLIWIIFLPWFLIARSRVNAAPQPPASPPADPPPAAT